MFKRSFQLLSMILLVYGLASCGVITKSITGAEILPEQSNFKASYSIGQIIEAHQELLVEGPRTLSGSQAGPRVPFVQNQEVMVIQVDPNNTALLMEAIQSDIQSAFNDGPATISGSGGFDGQADPIAYFSYNYKEGPFYGVVDIWGIDGDADQFILISQVTESIDSGAY